MKLACWRGHGLKRLANLQCNDNNGSYLNVNVSYKFNQNNDDNNELSTFYNQNHDIQTPVLPPSLYVKPESTLYESVVS